MKALVFSEEGKSNILEVEVPKISNNEILLKVNSCGICGTDIKLEAGSSGKINKKGKKRRMNYPIVTGHELSGTIVEIGGNVSGYKIGDRINVIPNLPCGKCYYCQVGHHELCDDEKVIGFDYNGAFTEYMVIPERAIRLNGINKLSDKVTFEEATLVEPIAVSINCQNLSNVSLGNAVLFVGAGPIGCIGIQLAKINGAKKVMVAEISEYRLEFAEKFGADICINTTQENIVKRVLEETGGKGVDKIIICCSSSEMFKKSLLMVKKMGEVNFFASMPKDNSCVTLDANLVHYKEIKITGTYNSTPLHNKLAYELIERGAINVKGLITHRFSLSDYYKAIDTAKSGKGMKVVVNI